MGGRSFTFPPLPDEMNMDEAQRLLEAQEGHVVTLTINRPPIV